MFLRISTWQFIARNHINTVFTIQNNYIIHFEIKKNHEHILQCGILKGFYIEFPNSCFRNKEITID